MLDGGWRGLSLLSLTQNAGGVPARQRSTEEKKRLPTQLPVLAAPCAAVVAGCVFIGYSITAGG